MDGKKNQVLDSETLKLVPELTRVDEVPAAPLAPSVPPRSLTTGWATALVLAPLLLFVAIGEFAPEPTGDPTTVALAIGSAMLLALVATAGLAMAHKLSAAIPAVGLGAFGVVGQIDCAMQSHAATGTFGFWVITAAFAGLALVGGGAGASTLLRSA